MWVENENLDYVINVYVIQIQNFIMHLHTDQNKATTGRSKKSLFDWIQK